MTVQELVVELKDLPPDSPVFYDGGGVGFKPVTVVEELRGMSRPSDTRVLLS